MEIITKNCAANELYIGIVPSTTAVLILICRASESALTLFVAQTSLICFINEGGLGGLSESESSLFFNLVIIFVIYSLLLILNNVSLLGSILRGNRKSYFLSLSKISSIVFSLIIFYILSPISSDNKNAVNILSYPQ